MYHDQAKRFTEIAPPLVWTAKNPPCPDCPECPDCPPSGGQSTLLIGPTVTTPVSAAIAPDVLSIIYVPTP